MSFYNRSNPSDVRDLADTYVRWQAAGNPKAADWAQQPSPPSPNAVWVNGSWIVPQPAPDPPDWDRFQSGLQTANGFPAAWSAIDAGDNRFGIALIASLYAWRAQPQAWPQFLGAVFACLALLEPQQAANVAQELLALAFSCRLDPAFLVALEAQLEGAQ